MGGCCCSSRKPQLHGTPVFYYCPPDSEEHESLTSYDSVATALNSGILVDLNLDMSIPDTYRSPPAPIPYDVVLGHPDAESGQLTITGGSLEKANCADLKEVNCRIRPGFFPPSPRKAGIELLKSNPITVSSADDEDACPTCLEGKRSQSHLLLVYKLPPRLLYAEYDAENPKIMTRCNHHFHLSCILEWMERSDTCPICDQEMIYQAR